MPSRRLKVQLLSTLGFLTACYAAYVDSRLDADPFYTPACNSAIFGGGCSSVFKSPYAHPLSHWGLVPKSSPLDLSLASAGLFLYTCYFIGISIPFRFPFREELFLAAAVAGACFGGYLLYIIKFVLKDFCIVCFTFHSCNFTMLILAVLEYRNPEPRRTWPRRKQRKA